MKYRVVHTTAYRYSEPVTLGHSEAHLRPRVLARQTCWESRVDVLRRRLSRRWFLCLAHAP